MESIPVEILLYVNTFFGHLFADFFCQTRKMAANKYLPGKNGAVWCTIHVITYTLVVVMFTQKLSVLFFLGVFIPHWLIDRHSLAYQWMRVTGSANLLFENKDNKPSFGPLIYVVMDQTLHFFCLYLLLRYMRR